MNSDWLGDSYDVVKRFFVGCLRDLGYQVYVDPMPTGSWSQSASYLEFLGARHVREAKPGKTALLVDPDTGIGTRSSKKHTTIRHIVGQLDRHELVFVFDQSFSRGHPALPQLGAKLREFATHEVHAFFYDSHARFLFASRSATALAAAREAFVKLGLPSRRFVSPPREARRPTPLRSAASRGGS
jgi:hypothetical protein